jgi:hypothetical protein
LRLLPPSSAPRGYRRNELLEKVRALLDSEDSNTVA